MACPLARLMSTPRRDALSVVPVAMLLCLASDAEAQSCTPRGAKEETISMPTSLRYPRDTAVGTPLTAWAYSSTTVSRECTAAVNQGIAAMVDQGSLTKVADLKVTNETGVSVSVWETGLPGVGVAMTGRARDCNLRAWGDVPIWVGACGGVDNAETIPMQTQLGVRYVVIGPIKPGAVEPRKIARQLPTFGQIASYEEDFILYYSLTRTTVEAPACTTPDVAVSLGKQQVGDFMTVGSMTSAVSFSIAINSCDKDINSIKYALSSAQAQPAIVGVVGPNPVSTSSGIGVKVMRPDGTAVPLDGSKQTVSGYDAAVGGSLTIPLKAAMYRISTARPSGGTLQAEVQFTMYYE